MTQPAGWYADPSGLPARRWWDGRQWTDHVQPGGAPMPPPNGYFPPVPPTGPAGAEPHTVASDNPDQAPLYATQPAGLQHGGPPVVSEPRPFTPAPHPEVPTAPYTMRPVDAFSGRPGFVTPAPAPPVTVARPEAVSGWYRTAGPVALAVIAALVLTLTALVLLPG